MFRGKAPATKLCGEGTFAAEFGFNQFSKSDEVGIHTHTQYTTSLARSLWSYADNIVMPTPGAGSGTEVGVGFLRQGIRRAEAVRPGDVPRRRRRRIRGERGRRRQNAEVQNAKCKVQDGRRMWTLIQPTLE